MNSSKRTFFLSFFRNAVLTQSIKQIYLYEVLPGVHRRSSSVTMSTPLMRFSQNSSRLLDSGKRPDIPAMTISSMLNDCEQRERHVNNERDALCVHCGHQCERVRLLKKPALPGQHKVCWLLNNTPK